MIKKIKVEQLRLGMFISNFNCDWFNHPFFSNSKKIDEEGHIKKIEKHGLKEVYIDTEKGLDVNDAPTEAEVNREIEKKVNRVVGKGAEQPKEVSIHNEIATARAIRKEATETVRSIMSDVIQDNEIDPNTVVPVIDKMIGSVIRNHDALISLGQFKKTDEYTYNHSLSVCTLMLAFGKSLGFDAGVLRDIGVGALLHDIGKMKVPAYILHKRGKLSEQEYEIMKQHVGHGHSMLKETGNIGDIALLISCQHHERIDGSGYPGGLKGDEISIYGQASAIADVYDAITSERGYNNRVNPTYALRKLLEWSEHHFNAELVQKFIRCTGVYPVGTIVRLERGLLAIVLKPGKKGVLTPLVRVVYNTRKETFIPPYDIDLSDYEDSDQRHKIVSCELPDEWNINPQMYV